jgi:hypothetical protein
VLPGGTPITSSAQNPGAVTFSTPGTYVASLTVADNVGVNDPSPPTRTITVVVPPSFTLTVTRQGTGGGTVTSSPAGISCGSDCSQSYVAGTTVTLGAAPNLGSRFDGWSGPADCADGVVSVTQNTTCTARFTRVGTATLRVEKSGRGSGTVTSSPAGISCGSDCSQTYTIGTVVQLTPTPAAGSRFDGWSGNSDCSDGRVTMTGGKTCRARFTR